MICPMKQIIIDSSTLNLILNNQKKKEVHIFLLCASANMWICCRTYPCMPQSEKFMKKKDDWCAHCKKKKKKKTKKQRFFAKILCNEYIYVYG